MHFEPLSLADSFPQLFSTDSSEKSVLSLNMKIESLTDAWLRMKEMLKNCHGHNLSNGNIIKIFYHGLNEITQEVLNAAAGGIFLYETPNQAYQLLKNKVLLKLDWAKNKKTKSSLKKPLLLPMKFDRLVDKQPGRPSGSLPSNTQPNPRGSNSKAYQPPQYHNEHVNAVFTRSGKSYDPPDNPNDQQNKSENPINFDSDNEDDEPTPQPKTQLPKPVKETPLPKHTNQRSHILNVLEKKQWRPNKENSST
ncbi:hypothetical protein Tco_0393150 [Tanacetum coccineum]